MGNTTPTPNPPTPKLHTPVLSLFENVYTNKPTKSSADTFTTTLKPPTIAPSVTGVQNAKALLPFLYVPFAKEADRESENKNGKEEEGEYDVIYNQLKNLSPNVQELKDIRRLYKVRNPKGGEAYNDIIRKYKSTKLMHMIFNETMRNKQYSVKSTNNFANTSSKSNENYVNTSTKSNDKYVNTPVNSSDKYLNTPVDSSDNYANTSAKSNDNYANTSAKSNDNYANTSAKSNDNYANTSAKSTNNYANTSAKSNDNYANTSAKSNDNYANTSAKSNDNYANTSVKSTNNYANTSAISNYLLDIFPDLSHNDNITVKDFSPYEFVKLFDENSPTGSSSGDKQNTTLPHLNTNSSDKPYVKDKSIPKTIINSSGNSLDNDTAIYKQLIDLFEITNTSLKSLAGENITISNKTTIKFSPNPNSSGNVHKNNTVTNSHVVAKPISSSFEITNSTENLDEEDTLPLNLATDNLNESSADTSTKSTYDLFNNSVAYNPDGKKSMLSNSNLSSDSLNGDIFVDVGKPLSDMDTMDNMDDDEELNANKNGKKKGLKPNETDRVAEALLRNKAGVIPEIKHSSKKPSLSSSTGTGTARNTATNFSNNSHPNHLEDVLRNNNTINLIVNLNKKHLSKKLSTNDKDTSESKGNAHAILNAPDDEGDSNNDWSNETSYEGDLDEVKGNLRDILNQTGSVETFDDDNRLVSKSSVNEWNDRDDYVDTLPHQIKIVDISKEHGNSDQKTKQNMMTAYGDELGNPNETNATDDMDDNNPVLISDAIHDKEYSSLTGISHTSNELFYSGHLSPSKIDKNSEKVWESKPVDDDVDVKFELDDEISKSDQFNKQRVNKQKTKGKTVNKEASRKETKVLTNHIITNNSVWGNALLGIDTGIANYSKELFNSVNRSLLFSDIEKTSPKKFNEHDDKGDLEVKFEIDDNSLNKNDNFHKEINSIMNEYSPNKHKSIKIDNSLKKHNSTEIDNSLKKHNSIKIDNSLKKHNSIGIDNSLKKHNSIEIDNSLKKHNSIEIDNSLKKHNSIEIDNSLKNTLGHVIDNYKTPNHQKNHPYEENNINRHAPAELLKHQHKETMILTNKQPTYPGVLADELIANKHVNSSTVNDVFYSGHVSSNVKTPGRHSFSDDFDTEFEIDDSPEENTDIKNTSLFNGIDTEKRTINRYKPIKESLKLEENTPENPLFAERTSIGFTAPADRGENNTYKNHIQMLGFTHPGENKLSPGDLIERDHVDEFKMKTHSVDLPGNNASSSITTSSPVPKQKAGNNVDNLITESRGLNNKSNDSVNKTSIRINEKDEIFPSNKTSTKEGKHKHITHNVSGNTSLTTTSTTTMQNDKITKLKSLKDKQHDIYNSIGQNNIKPVTYPRVSSAIIHTNSLSDETRKKSTTFKPEPKQEKGGFFTLKFEDLDGKELAL